MLTIRKIKCDNVNIKASYTKKEFAANDSTTIHVEFNSENKLGNDKRMFFVYMNNPVMPEVKFELQGMITK